MIRFIVVFDKKNAERGSGDDEQMEEQEEGHGSGAEEEAPSGGEDQEGERSEVEGEAHSGGEQEEEGQGSDAEEEVNSGGEQEETGSAHEEGTVTFNLEYNSFEKNGLSVCVGQFLNENLNLTISLCTSVGQYSNYVFLDLKMICNYCEQ